MSEKILTNAPVKEKKAEKKPKSKARKIIEWILFGIFGVLFAFVLAGNVSAMIHANEHYGQQLRFGFGSFIVTTTSMEPVIKKDSAIITYREDVRKLKPRFDSLKEDEFIDVAFFNTNPYLDFEPDTEIYKRENGGECITTDLVVTHRIIELHEDTSVEYGKGRFVFVCAGINHNGEYAKMHQYQIFTEKQYLGEVVVNNLVLGKVFQFVASPFGLLIMLIVPAAYLIVTSSIDIIREMNRFDEESGNGEGVGGLSNLSAEDKERLKRELLDEMIAEKKGKKKDV